VTRIYSVRDLVFQPNNAERMSTADLAEVVVQAVGADSGWITAEDSGLLSVSASPAMQDKVGAVLADLRRSDAAKRR